MKLKMAAYDLVVLENDIQERLETFSTLEKAIAYGKCLIDAGKERRWADKGRDGLSVSGPYKLRINPVFKQEKE